MCPTTTSVVGGWQSRVSGGDVGGATHLHAHSIPAPFLNLQVALQYFLFLNTRLTVNDKTSSTSLARACGFKKLEFNVSTLHWLRGCF